MDEVSCPHCGSPNRAGHKQCYQCAGRLDGTPEESLKQQVIVCWNCKTDVSVAHHQIEAATCTSCGAGISPKGRMVPFDAFLEEQRHLRRSSDAGPLIDLEAEYLTEILSPQLVNLRSVAGTQQPSPSAGSVFRRLSYRDVEQQTFKVSFRGYAEDEVDAFMIRVREDLHRWEGGDIGELTPEDVQQQRFQVALRGYAEGEVDQFVDRVVEQLRMYHQLNPQGPRKLTALGVLKKTFKVALRGYDEGEVDEFLDRVESTLREWEAGRKGELIPTDVQQRTFKVSLRGYAEDEVDEFLDEVVIALRDHEQEARGVATGSVVVPKRRPVRLPKGVDGGVAEFREPPPEPADEEPPTTPVEAASSTDARLLVVRPDGGGRPFTVMFDGQPLGKLKPGNTGEFDIPTGLHWVTVRTRRYESNTMMIEPHEGDQVRLECHPAGGDQTDDLGRTIDGILLERVDS